MSVTFCYKIEVRFRDCDEFGHVNNAVYFTYLEETRHAYLRHLASQGVSSNAVDEKLPHGFVLVRTECDFLSEALPGDWLEIQLRVSKIGRSSFGYEYEIRNTSKSQLVARAKSVHVAYDRNRSPKSFVRSLNVRCKDYLKHQLMLFRTDKFPLHKETAGMIYIFGKDT